MKCIKDEIPFEIPESWVWVRLSSLGEIVGGGTPKTSVSTYWDNGNIPWITPADMKYVTGKYIEKGSRNITEDGLKNSSACMMPTGTIIYSSRAPIGYIAITSTSLCTNQGFKSFVPIFTYISNYIYYCLIALTDEIRSRASGTTFKEISGTELGNTLIPFPPYDEQNHIVGQIEKVLPFLSEYDTIDISLQKLTLDFPIRLCKSILQYAVQGKLVPQNKSDEPASVLLERIRGEKEELIKQGKLKKDKHESVIFRRDNSYYERLDGVERCIDDEIPFEIPQSWLWVRLAEICTYIQRGKSPKYSPIRKYPVIAQKCIQRSGFSIESARFIEPNSLQSYAKERLLEDNDLMWNSTGLGSLGRIGIYKSNLNPFELAVADSHVTVIRSFKSAILSKYLYYFFSNPSVQNTIEDSADGSTKQKELATSTIKTYLVPIPPLSEQKYIVNKVEELLKVIKTL